MVVGCRVWWLCFSGLLLCGAGCFEVFGGGFAWLVLWFDCGFWVWALVHDCVMRLVVTWVLRGGIVLGVCVVAFWWLIC